MKKNIFYWAFLVLAGMGLTACSSGDDNIADNTTPVTPDSQNKKVILTGTIGVGGDETRAVDNNGVTSWKANDPITINYETATGYSRATGTIKQVSSDNHFATFEATLENPKNDGYIGFAYGTVKSATPSNAYNFEFNYDAYSTQYGTTAAITSSGLDYACTEEGGEVKMAVKDSKATLKSTALLKNQFSMFEFTLVKEGATSTNVPATKLQIFIKSNGSFPTEADYTITPANSDAYFTFYVALEPTADDATIEGVKIVASFDGKDPAIKLNTAANVAKISTNNYGYGKFICVDEAAGAENQAYLCSSENSAYYCEHTYSTSKFVKGKLYSANLTVKDLTPTAVIAYTGNVTNYCDNFIALALSDATAGETTLSDGQAAATSWAGNHSVKMYSSDESTTTLYNESNNKYDVVKANPQDASHHFTAATNNDVVSNQRATGLTKGWRIPTVTDLRYIFSQLKTGGETPTPVINNGITPTNPQGIMDHNGVYGYYNTSTSSWVYPYNTNAGYYKSANYTTLKDYINALYSSTDIDGQYYWLGSGVIKENESSETSGKNWRYNFSYDFFEWNETGQSGGDTSKTRLVFAY